MEITKEAGLTEAIKILRDSPLASTALTTSVFAATIGALQGAKGGSVTVPDGGHKAVGALQGATEGAAIGAVEGAAVGAIAGALLNRNALKPLAKDLAVALKTKVAEEPLRELLKKPTVHEQRKNIRKALRVVKPRSKSEADVQELAGRAMTPGQVVRRGAIGALGGTGAGVLGGLVTGSPLTVRKAVEGLLEKGQKIPTKAQLRLAQSQATFGPRRMLAGAIGGTAFGLGIPYLQRKADIEAARRGQF
jgi:hypothetical protein